MQLTHFGHACVLVETDRARILIDPGTLSEGFAHLTDLDAVLVTHQHPDHLDPARIAALLAANSRAAVITDEGAYGVLASLGIDTDVAVPGARFDLGGSRWSCLGGTHAVVHARIPPVPNIAYLLDDGAFFHPGDSFDRPPGDVDVLALPTSGPWLKVGEVIDYLNLVAPRVAVPIHERALADTTTTYGMLARLAPGGSNFLPVEHGTAFEV